MINVLSECTFLPLWTMGLWAAVRFLRAGRFVWLPPTIAFGALAYLARPEGILLVLTLVLTLLVLPLHRATRIYWPRWWAAVAFLVLGSALLVGPYMAVKGSIGTRPAIARLIGLEPPASPLALERDRPLPADQTTFETYLIALRRVERRSSARRLLPILGLAVLGILVARPWTTRARVWLFGAILMGLALVGLVRLHVTGGYCTVRHALIPALIFRLAAAHGLAWLFCSVSIEGRWLGLGAGRLRPGPAIWALTLAVLLGLPLYGNAIRVPGSFAPYRDAGSWLAQIAHDPTQGKILDMTDWSLFFSDQPGFALRDIPQAIHDPGTRWILARRPTSTAASDIAGSCKT